MILQLLATWIPALLIALSGVMKLSGNPKILESMTTLGVGRYVRLLGVMELAFATLFVVPATFKLGFVLASCYFAARVGGNSRAVNPARRLRQLVEKIEHTDEAASPSKTRPRYSQIRTRWTDGTCSTRPASSDSSG
jgi:hypothetical protein